MERQLVSHEKPVAILTGVFPEYSREGIAVDCGHVILCRQGSARMTLNFRELRQEKDVTVILYPGDVVMVQDVSDDFAIEYLVVTDDIMTEAQLELSQADAIRDNQHVSSHEIAALADAPSASTTHLPTVPLRPSTSLSKAKAPTAAGTCWNRLASPTVLNFAASNC